MDFSLLSKLVKSLFSEGVDIGIHNIIIKRLIEERERFVTQYKVESAIYTELWGSLLRNKKGNVGIMERIALCIGIPSSLLVSHTYHHSSFPFVHFADYIMPQYFYIPHERTTTSQDSSTTRTDL